VTGVPDGCVGEDGVSSWVCVVSLIRRTASHRRSSVRSRLRSGVRQAVAQQWGGAGWENSSGPRVQGPRSSRQKNRNIFFSPSILMVVMRRMSGICGSTPIACSRLQFVNTISVELALLQSLRPPVYVIQFCRRPRVGINSWNYDVRVIGKHGSSAPHQRITQLTS